MVATGIMVRTVLSNAAEIRVLMACSADCDGSNTCAFPAECAFCHRLSVFARQAAWCVESRAISTHFWATSTQF